MMIFNISGGGGTTLNFRVVGGTTAPTNPAENCIWVNTDTPITSWLFSATEPSPAEAGMVWISVGTSSSVEFNALKKNGIQVYPLSAKQYVSGAWVDVTAMSYQGGEWVEWIPAGALYWDGNECESLTGGWSNEGWILGSNTISAPTKTDSSMTLTGVASTSIDISGTQKTVEISGKTTLWVQCSSTIADNGVVFCVTPAKDASASNRLASARPTEDSELVEVDVSALDGSYYICCIAANSDSVTVYRIWLE